MSIKNDRFWAFNLSMLSILNIIVMIVLSKYVDITLTATRISNDRLVNSLLELQKDAQATNKIGISNNNILKENNRLIKNIK